MIFYEILKLVRNKAFLCALAVLLLLNGACIFYQAQHISEKGYSLIEVGAVAEKWSGMSVQEASDDIMEELQVYYTMLSENSTNNELGQDTASSNSLLLEENFSVSDIEKEYIRATIFANELSRMEELSKYSEYRQMIRTSAEAMSLTGLFGGSNSFAHKVAASTAQVYEQLSVYELTADIPYGISLVIDNGYTGYILLLIEIALALLLFLQERESGMLSLLLSKSAGKGQIAAAKLVTIWMTSALVCLLFYGSSFLLAWKLVGLGALSRPIQTLTGFFGCPWELSVGAYLVIFLLFRILTEAALGTIFSWLCILLKNGKVAIAVICAVFVIESFCAAYGSSWLQYFNLVTLRNPNAFFSDYFCLNLFGIPANVLAVDIFAFIVFLVSASVGVVICYQRQWAVSTILFRPKRIFRKNSISQKSQKVLSVNGQEIKKLFYYRGGLTITMVLLLVQVLFWCNTTFRITPEVFYYRTYAAQFSGVISEQTEKMMIEEADRLDTSDEEAALYQALEAGTITQDYYDYAMEQLQTDFFQEEAFARIKTQYERTKEIAAQVPTVELIDIEGWNFLLGKDGLKSNLICLILVLFCEILLFCSYGVYEKITRVDLLINTSYTGYKNVYQKKQWIVMGQSFLLATFGFFPRWIRIVMYYGLDGIGAPVASFTFGAFPAFITMAWLLTLFVVSSLAVSVLFGTLIWKLSMQFSNIYGAMFITAACFILPMVVLLLFLHG